MGVNIKQNRSVKTSTQNNQNNISLSLKNFLSSLLRKRSLLIFTINQPRKVFTPITIFLTDYDEQKFTKMTNTPWKRNVHDILLFSPICIHKKKSLSSLYLSTDCAHCPFSSHGCFYRYFLAGACSVHL